MNTNHPKVKKIIRQCERRIMKLTGRHSVNIFILYAPTVTIPYEEIERVVCEVTGIRIDLARLSSRRLEYRTTRQLICFYARAHTLMSYKLIGQKVNRNDHTTVRSSELRIKSLLESGDAEVCRLVREINSRIEKVNKKTF